MDRIVYMTVIEMARGIRKGQFSAVEALEAHLQQIARHNRQVNAVVTIDEEGARGRAREADAALARGELWGPLHGVPVAIKDTWETAGMRTTASTRKLQDYIPQQDATVVARLKAAGAIVYGKTNMPEMAMDVQTNSPLFGRTDNPWNLNHTAGGSTGGGAAALAAGFSPLEVGSDLGGSIRIPAHYCGVFGIKTTNRRIPASGHIPPVPADLANPSSAAGLLRDLISIGPLARSVADLRLALELLAGPDGRQNDLPPVPLRAAPEKAWSGYHIAWCDEIDVPVNGEIRAAIASLARSLKRLGADVEIARPDFFSLNDVLETYGELVGAQMAVSGMKPPLPGWALRMAGHIEKSSPIIRGYEQGMGAGLPDYVQSLARRDETMRVLERFMEKYDAWLLPVTSTPAFRHIPSPDANSFRLATLDVDSLPVNYMTATSAYVCPFNVTGQPVVVIPIGRTKAGLPFGIQIVGRRWSDEALLALADKISSELTGSFCPPEGY